jgi:UDP-N-acetylmuramoylalanine--D-glutamate ligase
MYKAILGCSTSGLAAGKLLQTLGYTVFGIDRQEGFHFFPIKKEKKGLLDRVDLLVVSPGIIKEHFLLKEAKEKNVEVIGEIELGLRYLKNKALAVTGTNGKSTVTLLITHLLNQSGKKAIALGNNGVALCEKVLELDKETLVVLELSSYQLEWIQTKKIEKGIVLNLEEDHLDRYKEFVHYAQAKALLLDKVQGSVFVNKKCTELFPFFSKKNAIIFNDEQIVATLNQLGYTYSMGESRENIFAAWLMVKEHIDKQTFLQKIQSFCGLDYRCENIGTLNQAIVYNDSKATNPAAVFYALTKVPKKAVLLLGGLGKRLSFQRILLIKEKICAVLCFGKAGKSIAQELFALDPSSYKTLEEAAYKAFSLADKDNCILFSPGCASFDAFTDYQERGSFFEKLFIAYKKEMNL